MAGGPSIAIRQARADDRAAIAAFTDDTWPDREATDYVPRVFHEWVESDGPEQRTLVATVDGEAVGLCQGVALSEHEAWAQGMRVAPDHRDRGVARRLTDAVFEWAADRGATVCRNLVFSWNVAGLGTARSLGFAPVAAFRWAHPEPDATGAEQADLRVVDRPAAAWTYWQRSDARDALSGLALDHEETWALSELTHGSLRAAAEEARVFAVQHEDGTRGLAVRVRAFDHAETDEHVAEYGVAGWADPAAAEVLFTAVAADAATVGADRTRVLVPETPRHVSDAAAAGVDVADAPDFVLAADLTGR